MSGEIGERGDTGGWDGSTGSTGYWDGSAGGGSSGPTGRAREYPLKGPIISYAGSHKEVEGAVPDLSKSRRTSLRRNRRLRDRYPCLPVHTEWGAGRMEKMQRNARCPCGSGRKFKKCCGR